MTSNSFSVSPEFSSALTDDTSRDTLTAGTRNSRASTHIQSLARSFGLLPYQSAFAADPAPFKIGLWARQTGKDHTATFEAVIDSIARPGTLWIILAASERQALESLAKAKEWAQTLQLHIADYNEHRGTSATTAAAARLQSAEIKWANGSRLLALPANPNTIRGYSANLILTEFAFHEHAGQIWRAIYPSLTNPLKGGQKKLRIISTPNGPNNKFAQLWNTESRTTLSTPNPAHPNQKPETRNEKLPCSRSLITIHEAIAQGLPIDAEQLRLGLNDDDAWAQEYLCQFTDTSTVLLPYDLIETCESPEATESPKPLTFNLPTLNSASTQSLPFNLPIFNNAAQAFAGIDFGRKNHLTVCWLFERLNHKLVTREVLTLKNMSTPDQLQILRPRLKRCHKACIDYTGAGVGLGDYLAKEFGQWIPANNPSTPLFQVARAASTAGKVELCQFTNNLKNELFPRLRAAFEDRQLLIPSSPAIREDLHSIHRIVSPAGHISYRARSTPDGHSDRCTALALALRAATHAPANTGGATVVHTRRRRFL